MWGNFLKKVPPHPFKNFLTYLSKANSKGTDRQSARAVRSLLLAQDDRQRFYLVICVCSSFN